jgi:tetratricopeptide (TPR) repeat protein
VLDVALADHPATTADPTALVLRAVANLMLGRNDAALKDLAHPAVGNQYDAPLWRAVAQARLGKWADAREGFRNSEAAIGTMPIELQRVMMKDMIRADIEVGDITAATTQFHEFESIGIPREFEPPLALLAGRIAEALGRIEDALREYQAAVDSSNRPVAAQARLRQVVLQLARGNLKHADATTDLETLTTIWRGDDTEVEGLQLLARLYTEDNRYREAFQIMRTALSAHPNSDLTRRIQNEAAATFDSVFLAGRGDALPAIDAIALFYDFRELTPIGRRGDEMIRRLADRLVSVDLLDQAADLLKHQVDNRLQGAARAQVATRLAVVYMMNRKAERAIATLRATRTAELSNELRNLRLLLEARSLSDLGRPDLALEVAANIPGPEAIRLRSDILWSAKRYAQSAEQTELLYGDRWQNFEPLNDTEHAEILRAAVGYALDGDTLGLMRFRERYAAKLADGPDRRNFEIVASPFGFTTAEFRDVMRTIAQVDSLDNFLRDLRLRFPEAGALPATLQRTPAPEAPITGTSRTAPPNRTAAR